MTWKVGRIAAAYRKPVRCRKRTLWKQVKGGLLTVARQKNNEQRKEDPDRPLTPITSVKEGMDRIKRFRAEVSALASQSVSEGSLSY